MSDILLDVKNLRTTFHTYEGEVRAADGIDLTVCKGQIVGIVGESGCGKSVTSLSLMRLIPSPPGEVRADKMELNGVDLLRLSEVQMNKVRGNEISMIFQEPMSSLNPVFTVGDQIMEALQMHQQMDKAQARKRAVEMLELVHIPSPAKRVDDYPHQLSGGMRQRVMIAIALACQPSLLIADEPTTALDVTIQAQILDLLCQLQGELGMAIMLITHDLGVVAEVAERVVVMYAGVVVENADVESLFARPLHPYTQGLLASLPRLDGKKERLNVIPGAVPNLLNLPAGCRFAPRCPHVMDVCRKKEPQLLPHDDAEVRCWLYAEEVKI
ncbi:MAG: ABC transporter ATP-binding protein [Bacillota bacterium]|nr:ABC transporter ATP-binding protein [Bacillota bacterium]MDW7683862.1 ABC transporter ATP-binding protein [Bacillota bacterium]